MGKLCLFLFALIIVEQYSVDTVVFDDSKKEYPIGSYENEFPNNIDKVDNRRTEWKPPSRLIPLKPIGFNRVPLKTFEASENVDEESGSGSGNGMACDDEDRMCDNNIQSKNTEKDQINKTRIDSNTTSNNTIDKIEVLTPVVNPTNRTSIKHYTTFKNTIVTIEVSTPVLRPTNRISIKNTTFYNSNVKTEVSTPVVNPTNRTSSTGYTMFSNTNAKTEVITPIVNPTNRTSIIINTTFNNTVVKTEVLTPVIDLINRTSITSNTAFNNTIIKVEVLNPLVNEMALNKTVVDKHFTRPVQNGIHNYSNCVEVNEDCKLDAPTLHNNNDSLRLAVNTTLMVYNTTITNGIMREIERNSSSVAYNTSGDIYKSNRTIKYNLSEKSVCSDGACGIKGKCIERRCVCTLGKTGPGCKQDLTFHHPSFSNQSYMVFAKMNNLYRSFNIDLEFRSNTLDGLILYSGATEKGDSDFFAVVLQNGHVQLRYDCGSGYTIIKSSTKIDLYKWHHVTIRRAGQKGWIQVDKEMLIMGKSKGKHSNILTNQVYLGGLPRYDWLGGDVGAKIGFSGCIRKFVVNGRYLHLHYPKSDAVTGWDISDCGKGYCESFGCQRNATCVMMHNRNAKCVCPFGTTGVHCNQDTLIKIPQFGTFGYLEFPALNSAVRRSFIIEIVFKTLSSDGLILYNGDKKTGKGDFISVFLKDRYVVFQFDCGTGPALIRSHERIELNKWNTLKMSRKGRNGQLQVNKRKPTIGLSKGPFTMQKLSQPLYIGGLEHFGDIAFAVGEHRHFQGCIQKVTINNKQLKWTDTFRGQGITNCKSHPCITNPCGENGICEPSGATYACHCRLGYKGISCEKEARIQTLSFGAHSFLKFNNSAHLNKMKKPVWLMLMTFKTSNPNGLIVWYGQANPRLRPKGDFMSLSLENGFLVYRYNLGSGTILLNSSIPLNDGHWHAIQLRRITGDAMMVFDKTTIRKRAIGYHSILNADGPLYIGGAEDIAETTKNTHQRGFSGCMKWFCVISSGQGSRRKSLTIDLVRDAAKGHHIQECKT